jgi:hypothetical protein
MYNIITTGPFGPINTGVPAAVMAIGALGDFRLFAGVALILMGVGVSFAWFRSRRQQARSF